MKEHLPPVNPDASTGPGRMAPVMTMNQPENTCQQPSQAQLALAIAIVNAKPAAVPVLDHISHICSHIKNFKCHPPGFDSCKYFDSVAFWKNAYTKAEDEQSKLNNRIYELEQRVESLKGKLKDSSGESTPERGKREASKDFSPSQSRGKRQKTTAAPLAIGIGLEQLDDAISRLRSEESSVGSLLRHLSILQQNMRKRPNWAVLCVNAINLCKAAGSAVTSICADKQKTMTGRDAVTILAVVEEAHRVVCQCINKMLRSNEGQKYEGQATYHLVSFFEVALHSLDKLCRFQALEKDKTKQILSKSTLRNSGVKSPKVAETNSADEVSENIRRLIAGMLLTSTTVIAKYENVFEGYLVVLLRRVGTVLSAIVFNEMVFNPELQASETNLPIPDGLVRAGSDVVSLQASQYEAIHLAWLLEKAVALVYSLSMKSTFGVFDGPKTGETPKGSLLRFTKKKMQRTLLKAVFREDEPLFLDSLKRPQPGKISLPDTEDEMDPEWFSREVWRLLGWDILESIWK
ncbi:hypothetical protein PISL3812_07700 [Talaromyces islandicus]|uniref:Uncharacterized protein n=1 Tax=Talaromyces islandicus TaxID=28573 RepID=A0A0U1M6W7_TALIS|nr:hypothetical protein PISL3812_07700 [Talaromyces islandicus]